MKLPKMIPQGLRVAFFGSDKFSISSLRSLLQLQARTPGLLASVDVITRNLKPKGRNLKILEDLPVGDYATQHNVRVLRADTKEQIVDILAANKAKYDLCVAVSYGRLIPRKFIEAMTYGGLNVHPSLLPRYSGSSPMQYALMNDDKFTGVTVQTLHPTKFDKGDIIRQSDPIPIEPDDNYTSLEAKLGRVGGELLSEVIEKGMYVNGGKVAPKYKYSSAFKISTKMAQICWEMSAQQIKRRLDALGPLYTYIQHQKSGRRRVILHDVEVAEEMAEALDHEQAMCGAFVLENDRLLIKTGDGCIRVSSLTFECFNQEQAPDFYRRLKKRTRSSPKVFLNK